MQFFVNDIIMLYVLYISFNRFLIFDALLTKLMYQNVQKSAVPCERFFLAPLVTLIVDKTPSIFTWVLNQTLLIIYARFFA